MSIDKSLTDDFPSVKINGQRYNYGREMVYGQYLVENAEYAKDHWCFNTKEDLRAFLVNLPESAEPGLIRRRHPDWHDVTSAERDAYMEEHRVYLRKLMAMKEEAGTARWFNVLRFDD